jgi:hypothetical protein
MDRLRRIKLQAIAAFAVLVTSFLIGSIIWGIVLD